MSADLVYIVNEASWKTFLGTVQYFSHGAMGTESVKRRWLVYRAVSCIMQNCIHSHSLYTQVSSRVTFKGGKT